MILDILKPIGTDNYPEPHKVHVLLRDGKIHTCTVCYGLHDPWWIVHTTVPNKEAEPVSMLPTDRHCRLDEFIKS